MAVYGGLKISKGGVRSADTSTMYIVLAWKLATLRTLSCTITMINSSSNNHKEVIFINTQLFTKPDLMHSNLQARKSRSGVKE